MFNFLQVFLREGLVESEPINMQFTKLINRTCEEFLDWADRNIQMSTQHNKKALYDSFLNANPRFKSRLQQREFTNWLKYWADYKKLKVSEGHSNEVRYIQFSPHSTT